MTDEPKSRLQGIILRAQSGFYDVQTDAGRFVCHLRGRLKKGQVYGDIAAVGDRVTVTPASTGEGSIESIEPRQRSLVRVAPNPKGAYQQVLLANLDQVVVVFACARPEPRLRMLDRFLVIAEKQGIPALIVANKLDLVAEDQARSIFGHYEKLGYPVFYISARTRLGIERLCLQLQGKLTAFTGPSGVGKSSLLNLILPNLRLIVHDVSLQTGKGRHTTLVRELFPLETGGYVADMPGIKALSLWDIQPEELDGYFPELRDLIEHCQFSDCSHKDEPGCAVRAAAEDGRVHPERYLSYLRMRYGES